MRRMIFLLLLLAAACTQTQPDVVEVGVLVPLTGDTKGFGQEIRQAIEEVDVQNVRFVFEDTQCYGTNAIQAYNKLKQIDNVKLIIGPACGTPQETVAASADGTILLLPSAATKELYERSDKHMYQLQYSLEDESTFIAEQMYEQGLKKVALITFQNAFSQTHAETFQEAFEGEIAYHGVLKDTTSDVRTELVKIQQYGVDAIYSPDISFFIAGGRATMKELGIDTPVYATYPVALPFMKELVPDVHYSYPQGIGERGVIYELAQDSAKLADTLAGACREDIDCIREQIETSPSFENGIRKQDIILKQI